MLDQFLTRAHLQIRSRLLREERGATAVEYGLIVGLIAVVIIGAVLLLGTQLDALFGQITGDLGEIDGVPAPPAG